MTYDDCLTHLYGLHRHGIKLGLENITQLLTRLSHPEERFPVLHIGGTNGKGSSAAIAANLLRCMGLRVGLYTSPHLVDFRERIRVQGECIGKEAVREFLRPLFTEPSEPFPFTFFEITTALAFCYFAEKEVDIAVVEVGMGGRFDATNVCHSIATLVTTVAMDHEQYLGDTLQAIAFEKAGIFKPQVPVILGSIPGPANEVLMAQADRVGAPLFQYGKDFVARGTSDGRIDYDGMSYHFQSLPCPLEGLHQVMNVANALALLEVCGIPGLSFTEESIRDGLQSVQWEGRLECVGREPLVYLDGAHNPAGALVLVEYLTELKASAGDRRLLVVLGMMRDKQIHEFITILSPIVDTLVLTRIDHPLSATLDELKQSVPATIRHVNECPQPQQAWDLAHQLAGARDLICVTGSLFLIGHMKSLRSGYHYEPIVG